MAQRRRLLRLGAGAALAAYSGAVAALVRRFDRVEIKHVPREDNARADLLVNQALDGLL